MKPVEIDEGCQFLKDIEPDANTGRNYNLGMWNLSLSIRDLKLYSKGIKPHRRWKISPVKEYFGVNGSKKTLLSKLQILNKALKGES